MDPLIQSDAPKANEDSTSAPTGSGPNPSSPSMSYRGPVSGLKGLLSRQLAVAVSSVADKVIAGSKKVEGLKSEGGTEAIPLDLIHPCPDQPRQVFEPKALEELAATMRELGQAQAITVRKTMNGYEIIAGERRYRAAKLAGLKALDCVVKTCTVEEGRLLALVENTQRQDLLPIEEAHYLKRVLEDNPSMSLEKLAKTLGSHKSTLSEKVQLTELPEELQTQLYGKGRFFTHRHWRVVSRIQDPAVLRTLFANAVENQMSVAELERSVASMGISRAPRRRSQREDSQMSFFGAQAWMKQEGDWVKLRNLQFQPAKLTLDQRLKIAAELKKLLSLVEAVEPVQPSEDLASAALSQ